jgi:hypothetical protein
MFIICDQGGDSDVHDVQAATCQARSADSLRHTASLHSECGVVSRWRSFLCFSGYKNQVGSKCVLQIVYALLHLVCNIHTLL